MAKHEMRELGHAILEDEKLDGKEVINSLLKVVASSVGKRIKDCREVLKMNQGDLAIALNTTQSEIAKVESGQRAVNFDTTKSLAKALKTTVEWLITGKR